MALSSPGIGSNLDVNGIITKLMQVESQPLVALAKKEASFQAKLSAFGALSGALGGFQNALTALQNPSTFQSLAATASDTAVLGASASGKASAGAYNINVTQLAQAQTISTSGAASTSAAIGNGSTTKVTFQFGTISGGTLANGEYSGATFTQNADQPSGSVTIDSSNNSLQGIRDAINKANIGVTATIVADGSATPNRLVLTSTKTGAASSMKITVDSGNPGLSDLLAYDPAGDQNLSQNIAAQNSLLTINGIAISSATTYVASAIEGVTLNLSKIGSSTVTVARSNGAVQSGLNALVKSYNDLNTTIKNLSGFDPATRKGGPLTGDAAPRNIQAQIRKLVSTPLGDGNGGFTTLSQVGITIQKDGTMSLDSTKLQSALTANPNGVASLFSAFGTTTDSLISFDGSTSATQAGTREVFVRRLATQGVAVGTLAQPLASTVITSGNKDLTVTVNGVNAAITLTESPNDGSGNPIPFSPAALAAQIQSTANGTTALSSAGISVTAAIDSNGQLKLTSNRYGSASSVSVSGSAVSDLFGTPAVTAGLDVAGSVGGVDGTGSGQALTGATGSSSEGLKLLVSGGAENVSRGSVVFSQGYAVQLNKLIEGFVGTSGLLKGRTDGIDRSIKDIDRARSGLNERLAAVEKRYRAQFTALDAAISRMSQTSTYLSQQLAQLGSLSAE